MQFAELTDYFAQLEATTSRNKMVEILADLFRQAKPEEVDEIIYLSQGRVAPLYAPVEFGVGESLIAEAIARAAGVDKAEVRKRHARLGDFGLVAEELLPDETAGLSVEQVFTELRRLADLSGSGTVDAKVRLLADLLGKMGKREARYFLRIPLDRLRLGIGDPTVMDALSFARAGDKSLRADLERAYNIRSDLGQIGRLFWEQGVEALRRLDVQVGTPIRPAAAERESSAEAIVLRTGRCAAEPKYDGFRLQVHRNRDEVQMFSRNLENMTEKFPEIVEGTRKQLRPRQAIFEGEALAYDPATGEFHPFQVTVQRRRKYGIEELQARLPLKLIAFDLLYADGGDLTHRPYAERRKALEAAVRPDDVVEVAEMQVLDDPAKLAEFFADKVSRGLEGIVCKRLDAGYQAGARNFNWIKLKRSYQGELQDTVDTVIVGYWYGRGARAKLGIGSLLTAVYDPDQDKLYTISRLATGFSEEEWARLKALLDQDRAGEKPARVESLITPDVWVEPRYVVEVQADELTRSPMHTAGLGMNVAGATEIPETDEGEGQRAKKPAARLGYALRFPRVVGFIREDKGPEDATTVAEVLRLYQLQGKQPVKG